jgi:hypothetical protein
MGSLKIDLQEGFDADAVIIHVNGQEVYRKQDVKTRMQIGRADGIEVTVPEGEATVQVDLPDRNLTESRSLPVTAQTHLAVNLTRTGELKLTEAPEGFRYA